MNCNTEWTKSFLKTHFSESFISEVLRAHTSTILLQQQIAMLPATQPAVERQLMYEQYMTELSDIQRQIKELMGRKKLLLDDMRILKAGGGLPESEHIAFQHKCCDPECRGFVSSAWKCGLCSNFSCAHCHEVKGKTTEEIDAHVCNTDNVETVRLLRTDTKPCPGCGTYIHKTEGCDQMFCISCKQLWSWKTGRIEERGHNPLYLEWMRSQGEMARDPAEVQCEREIDWRVTNQLARQCTQRNIPASTARSLSKYAESLIQLRQVDIVNTRRKMETRVELENLRIQYMLKQISESRFKMRIFQIQRNANVSRQTVDLLVAVQNAGTDILYRTLDALNDGIPATAAATNLQCCLHELCQLHAWANNCLADVYSEHSKTMRYSFSRAESFALFTPRSQLN